MNKHIATQPLYIGRGRAFNAGDEVPEDHLARFGPARSDEHPEGLGWSELVETIAVDSEQPAFVSFDPSTATVDGVKAYVGDDPGRAQEALDAELRKPVKDQRSTLVEHLTKVAGTSS